VSRGPSLKRYIFLYKRNNRLLKLSLHEPIKQHYREFAQDLGEGYEFVSLLLLIGAAITSVLREKGLSMTTSDNSPKNAAEIAKKIILTTTEKSIPLTPENYHVWFEYFLGSNKELTDAIDALISAKEYFSQEINDNLYTDYLVSNKKDILKEVHKKTHKIFQNIFQASLSTNDLASDYIDKMEEYSNKLNDTNDLDEIQHLITDILKDTNDMAGSSRQLSQQLEEATSQIHSLSKKLEITEREAFLDGLTGLNNRRAFDKNINELCEKFDKNQGFFSVALLDVDYFKKFNDRYGHQVGDEVLRIFGEQLKENLKGKDFPSRYGGEEFAALLPNTKLNNAIIVAEQIRENISNKELKIKETGQKLESITISVGVSEICHGDTPISVIERADAALYLAKDSGRNNVKSEIDLDLAKTGT
jgi:diguanylate cyclase